MNPARWFPRGFFWGFLFAASFPLTSWIIDTFVGKLANPKPDTKAASPDPADVVNG